MISNRECTSFAVEFVDNRGGEEEATLIGLEGDPDRLMLLFPFSFGLLGILSMALLEPNSIEVILVL